MLVIVTAEELTKELAANVVSPLPEIVSDIPPVLGVVILVTELAVPFNASVALSKPVSTSTVTFLADETFIAILSSDPVNPEA